MRLLTTIFFTLTLLSTSAQEDTGGAFSLGMRNTISTFNHGTNMGLGYGGQFRIRLSDKLNTEWYADYITSSDGSSVSRDDAHIGWSVMFYPMGSKVGLFNPYVVTGHCFDYTLVHAKSTEKQSTDERWSSAVHLGIANQFRLHKSVDITLLAQYMSHLGNDIHIHDGEIQESTGFSLEGHLLLTVSANIYLFNLWNKGE